MKSTGFWILLSILMVSSPLMAENIERVLFSFEQVDVTKQWQCVNDGVMGGRSEGRIKISGGKQMEFYGNLSLANNGGFASVRSRRINLGLANGDSIVARIRGDGRKYSFNLYTPIRST